MNKRHLQARLIRLRDAAFFLGMDRNRFNSEVRSKVTEIRIGKQGIAFDVEGLNAYADALKAENGVSPNQKRVGKQLRRSIRSSVRTQASSTSGREAPGEDFTVTVNKLGRKGAVQ